MQLISRASSLGTSYSAAQVQRLFFSQGQETWVFYRLDQSKRFLTDITRYVEFATQEPRIEHDTTRAVKRTLDIHLRGDAPLNPLQDLIQPRYRRYTADGGFVEWPLGVFAVVPPDREHDSTQTLLTVQLPDVTQLLVDAAFLSSFTAPAGYSYTQVIAEIIASAGLATPIPMTIPDPGTLIPAPLTWEYGTSRLQAINDLLDAISYFPAWADETGALRSSQIPDYNTVTSSAVIDATTGSGAVQVVMQEKADISNAFNQVLVIGEDPRREPVVGEYINDNPLSPVSTVKWHPRLAPVVKDTSIPDEATATIKARALGQQYARIYSELMTYTLAWPVSQDNDIYRFRYQTRDDGLVDASYVEVGWTMQCRAGAPTEHRLTRIVPA